VTCYIAASIFIRLVNKHSDSEHPYDHRQLEDNASLVAGAFVVVTAVKLLWDSIDKVRDLLDDDLTTLGAHLFFVYNCTYMTQ